MMIAFAAGICLEARSWSPRPLTQNWGRGRIQLIGCFRTPEARLLSVLSGVVVAGAACRIARGPAHEAEVQASHRIFPRILGTKPIANVEGGSANG
jgi:hypothetical protein